MNFPITDLDKAIEYLHQRKPKTADREVDKIRSTFTTRQIGASKVKFFIIALKKSKSWVVQADDGTIMTELTFLTDFPVKK